MFSSQNVLASVLIGDSDGSRERMEGREGRRTGKRRGM
jgi:hypothetical protein